MLATDYSDKAARAVEEGFLLLEKPCSLEAMTQPVGGVDAEVT